MLTCLVQLYWVIYFIVGLSLLDTRVTLLQSGAATTK